MDFDHSMNVSAFVRLIIGRLDAMILLALVAFFLSSAAFPKIPELLWLETRPMSVFETRLTFMLMPVVLVAQYIWLFSTSKGGRFNLMIAIVLVVTSSVPFIHV